MEQQKKQKRESRSVWMGLLAATLVWVASRRSSSCRSAYSDLEPSQDNWIMGCFRPWPCLWESLCIVSFDNEERASGPVSPSSQ